jgi:ABC-type sugar transport system permease subunit
MAGDAAGQRQRRLTAVPASASAATWDPTAIPQQQAALMRRKARAQAGLAYLLIAPALAFLAFTYLYPTAQLIVFSLHQRGRGVWSGFDNYRLLFDDSLVRTSLLHNVELLALVPMLVGLSVLIAALLHGEIRGWKVYRIILFLPHMLPVVVTGIAFGFIYETHGALNDVLRGFGLGVLAQNWLGDPRFALPAVAAVIAWRQVGFGTILLLARMVQIPLDLYDSARIDGAGWWQTVWRVTVPQLSTIIAFYVGVIVIELFSWVFNYVYVLTKGGPGFSTYVSEVFIYDRAFGYDQMGIASAFSVVLLVGVFVAMFLYFGWLRGRDVF